MKSILMVVANGCNPDLRVINEAKLLKEIGYEVKILAWDREAKLPSYSKYEDIGITRVHYRSTYGSGLNQLKPMLKFWKSIIYYIKKHQPDYVHAHDFDTLLPTYLVSRNRMVFDAHEIYSEMISFHVPKSIVVSINFIEKKLLQKTPAVITVGKRMKEYYEKYNDNVHIVGNYREQVQRNIEEIELTKENKHLKDKIIISYIGVFGDDRLLIPFLKEVGKHNNIHMYIGGEGSQKEDIEKLSNSYPNIEYLGYLDKNEINYYLSISDYLYYGLKEGYINNYYSTPNSLFNAISTETPLITTNVGEIAGIVKDYSIGEIIESQTGEGIKEFISSLKLKEYSFSKAKNDFSFEKNKETLKNIYGGLI